MLKMKYFELENEYHHRKIKWYLLFSILKKSALKLHEGPLLTSCLPALILIFPVPTLLRELLHNKNKGINLLVGVFSNFNTVQLQFYGQTYSNSAQIYHCNNYITSLYFYQSIKFQLKICPKAEEKLAY